MSKGVFSSYGRNHFLAEYRKLVQGSLDCVSSIICIGNFQFSFGIDWAFHSIIFTVFRIPCPIKYQIYGPASQRFCHGKIGPIWSPQRVWFIPLIHFFPLILALYFSSFLIRSRKPIMMDEQHLILMFCREKSTSYLISNFLLVWFVAVTVANLRIFEDPRASKMDSNFAYTIQQVNLVKDLLIYYTSIFRISAREMSIKSKMNMLQEHPTQIKVVLHFSICFLFDFYKKCSYFVYLTRNRAVVICGIDSKL